MIQNLQMFWIKRSRCNKQFLIAKDLTIQTVLFHPFQPFERQIFSWTTEEAIAIRQVGYSHLDEVAETEVTSFAEHFGYQLT